jgi:hypothetical protein
MPYSVNGKSFALLMIIVNLREDSSLKDEIYTQKEALSQYFNVKIVEDLVKL